MDKFARFITKKDAIWTDNSKEFYLLVRAKEMFFNDYLLAFRPTGIVSVAEVVKSFGLIPEKGDFLYGWKFNPSQILIVFEVFRLDDGSYFVNFGAGVEPTLITDMEF